ncbi:hypothetical protein [Haliangium ochraceum]|uniref:Uncharacterized protein n=1 Tax=Haliangium ochraceum (strain DSM 14365 / JCM 11303 / SMP-2) TaxID=502025 RepID=D0LP58_HALO1|nr:hypothetical protein [Haliangium ochraceum]ACY13423.1 conserved hypothetical protein [Haliangium ochraceum DSM 14365]
MFRFSLNDYIGVLANDLPDMLVSPASRDKMVEIGNYLPGSMTRFFGFECRLDDLQGNADVLVCVSPYDQERSILADRCPSIHLPAKLWDEPVWRRVRAFAEAWNDAQHTLHDEVLNVWLEFDLHTHEQPWRAPSVFFGARADDKHAQEWMGTTALPLLRPSGLGAALQTSLSRCIEALPASAYVFQTGLMLSREDSPVRICIKDLPSDATVSYLQRVGWDGDFSGLERILAPLRGLVDRIDLDLDLLDGVGPKVGLECSFAGKPLPEKEPRWGRFIEHLVEQGLCEAALAQPILSYPRIYSEAAPKQHWPSALRSLSALLGSQFLSTIVCNLHHVKISYHSQAGAQAKLYLSVKHLMLPKSRIPRSAGEDAS